MVMEHCRGHVFGLCVRYNNYNTYEDMEYSQEFDPRAGFLQCRQQYVNWVFYYPDYWSRGLELIKIWTNFVLFSNVVG